MKSRLAWTVAALAMIAGTASSQDGGKIAWKGKGKDDLKAVLAEAQKEGKAMMMFFTSEG
jgi:hypothetical protein